jgi:hypothetical protein
MCHIVCIHHQLWDIFLERAPLRPRQCPTAPPPPPPPQELHFYMAVAIAFCVAVHAIKDYIYAEATVNTAT